MHVKGKARGIRSVQTALSKFNGKIGVCSVLRMKTFEQKVV